MLYITFIAKPCRKELKKPGGSQTYFLPGLRFAKQALDKSQKVDEECSPTFLCFVAACAAQNSKPTQSWPCIFLNTKSGEAALAAFNTF